MTDPKTYSVQIEVSDPIPDFLLSAPIERLHATIQIEGLTIGTIVLPVCDGVAPAYVLEDTITGEFAWPILRKFFQHHIYPQIELRRNRGLSAWRKDVCLAENLPDAQDKRTDEFHDTVGWTVFLQEVWGRPRWSSTDFYFPKKAREKVPLRRVESNWIELEISDDLTDLEVSGEVLNVLLTVGGVRLGVVNIPPRGKTIRACELRTRLTTASGFELCRVAAREALLGRPLSNPTPLRARLAARATAIKTQLKSSPLNSPPQMSFCLEGAVMQALLPNGEGVVLGRHPNGAIGTSVSRRAALPVGALSELLALASVTNQPVIRVPEMNQSPVRIVYAPEVLEHLRSTEQLPQANKTSSCVTQPTQGSVYDRHHFEVLFSKASDPWEYGSPYEQTKYERTLSLLPSGPIDRALELACAEGHFTVQLAPRVGRLVAADISEIALERAASRCAGLKNISFSRIEINRDPLPGRFNLIVCSEVLFYVGDKGGLRAAARKLAAALEPGGYLLMAHANLVVDEPDRTGFDWNLPFGAKVIGEVFSRSPRLRFLKELRTPLYRIQLFQRCSRRYFFRRRLRQEVIEVVLGPLPRVEAASHILWRGGSPSKGETPQAIVTKYLPILLYHRVAEAGSPSTAAYRINPEFLDSQLRYLRDAGYHSVRLEDWWNAMEGKKPLPGRAVILTFDDGYLDFQEQAWPLLKRYGFSAIVFLVAGEIGRFNSWDRAYGEEVPLLGWEDIRRLRDEGVEFGSHSTRHQLLGGLSVEEVVREAVRSRVILQRGLGVPVDKFAYPYGGHDQAIQHLIGACGYVFGLSCRQDLSAFRDSALALPRIEVKGSDSLEQFVAKLT